jgi:hypothetical protein
MKKGAAELPIKISPTVVLTEGSTSTFKSVAELKSAIMEYLQKHNANPKPFIWTKSAGEILEKVARAKQALESEH